MKADALKKKKKKKNEIDSNTRRRSLHILERIYLSVYLWNRYLVTRQKACSGVHTL